MLSIYNFESHTERRIFHRGESYYYGGAIKDFSVDGATYQALIEGSYLYNVVATLNAEGEILEAGCNCPYDRGMCKHLVAFFFRIREHITQGHKEKNSPPQKKEDYLVSLKAALKDKTKDELTAIIFEVTANSYVRQQQTLALAAFPLTASYLINMVRDSITRFGPTHQIINTINVVINLVTKETGNDVEHIIALFEIFGLLTVMKNDYEAAAALEEEESYYANYDDDYYEQEPEPFFGLDTLLVLVNTLQAKLAIFANNPPCPADLILGIRNFLVDLAVNLEEETTRILFTALFPFAADKGIYSRFLALFEKQGHHPYLRTPTHFFGHDFFFDLVRVHGRKDELETFLHDHREYFFFRRFLVEKAIMDHDYLAALTLINEANIERTRYELSGAKNPWNHSLITIYEALNDSNGLREPLLNLFSGGELDYYDRYRGTFTDEEWQIARPEFLVKVKNNDTAYAFALAKEEAWDTFFLEANDNLNLLLNGYHYLPKSYSDRVSLIIKKQIDIFILNTAGRTYYENLAVFFKVLQHFLTREDFRAYIADLEKTYAKRRALLKYLDKLLWTL